MNNFADRDIENIKLKYQKEEFNVKQKIRWKALTTDLNSRKNIQDRRNSWKYRSQDRKREKKRNLKVMFEIYGILNSVVIKLMGY